MKLVEIEPEYRPHIGIRREIRLKDLPLKSAAAVQLSELRPDRSEPYHTNQTGYVLCFVVTGWMVSISSIDYDDLSTAWED